MKSWVTERLECAHASIDAVCGRLYTLSPPPRHHFDVKHLSCLIVARLQEYIYYRILVVLGLILGAGFYLIVGIR